MGQIKMEINFSNWIQVLLLIVIIFLIAFGFLWIACGLESTCSDFVVWDLGISGPFCCADTGGGGADDDAEPPTNTDCVDLDLRLRADGYADIMDALDRFFDESGLGTWIEETYRVGFYIPAGTIDCYAIMHSDQGQRVDEACTDVGGTLTCHPNYLLCHCPGDVPFPSHECAWEYNNFDGLFCTGNCIEEKSCVPDGEDCVCALIDQDDSVTPCGLLDALSCQDGECPPGQYCDVNAIMTGCECFGQPL